MKRSDNYVELFTVDIIPYGVIYFKDKVQFYRTLLDYRFQFNALNMLHYQIIMILAETV